MMNSPVITIALIALCSWLGWTAYEETIRPVPSIDSRGPANGAETTKIKNKSGNQKTSIIFPPLEALGDIVSRPLFNVSRRPIKVEEPAPDVKPTDLNVMLSGIVIGETQQIAHLRSIADKQTLALKVGEKIGDWEIQSIFPDHVVLRSGVRVETLFMQKPGASKPAVGAPPRVKSSKPSSRRTKKRTPRRGRRNFRRNKRSSE